ncbi:hemolymph lipopolysaccharide-binding protein-like [Periplaneta americana]|uniref:hemolymph lipopolysaccharide-binding protein-like n=1 Tax=Periplaneta americana TaxID=6978 RepID=UPI0037E891D7
MVQVTGIFITFCFLLLDVRLLKTEGTDVSEFSCKSSKSRNIKLSVTSRRNRTGHWTSQAHLEHRRFYGGVEYKETEPVELDIDQTVTKCDDDEILVIVATVTSPPATTVTVSPGPDYEFVPEFGYYKLHRAAKKWVQAMDTCKTENAHLLIINSDKEAKAIQRVWLRHPKNFSDWRDHWVFVGIHDQFEEGKFITVFSQSLNDTGYTKWSQEPSRGRAENCGISNVKGEYGDADCAETMAFICEKEI